MCAVHIDYCQMHLSVSATVKQEQLVSPYKSMTVRCKLSEIMIFIFVRLPISCFTD